MQAATSTAPAQRPWACVVDPALAFTPEGPQAVRQLSRVLEVWVFRELWHILDNTSFFARAPHGREGDEANVATLGALGQWERLRYENDLLGLRLFWIGDGI